MKYVAEVHSDTNSQNKINRPTSHVIRFRALFLRLGNIVQLFPNHSSLELLTRLRMESMFQYPSQLDAEVNWYDDIDQE